MRSKTDRLLGVSNMPQSFVQYGQKIAAKDSPEKLLQDLNKYCSLAKEMGATEAKIISSSEVIVDYRVRVKCQYPICQFYGSNANCPPHVASPEETTQLARLYKYGILLMFKCPADRIVSEAQAKNAQDKLGLYKVISAVESAAFYDGYYFAVGFGSGPCKVVFCSENKTCSALEGNGCRAAAKSRASMEAVGMDVYSMVTRQGWDIYPIGRSCTSADVPEGTRVALVLVD